MPKHGTANTHTQPIINTRRQHSYKKPDQTKQQKEMHKMSTASKQTQSIINTRRTKATNSKQQNTSKNKHTQTHGKNNTLST